MTHLKSKRSNLRGRVRWFNNEKGYGFITCENCDDIFVHYSAVEKDGYKTLKEGKYVEFVLIETDKGLQATNVNDIIPATKM